MHSNGAERFLLGSQNLTKSRIQSRSERRSDGVTRPRRHETELRECCYNLTSTQSVGRLWLRVSTWIICIQPNWICLTKGYRKVNQPTRREKEDSCNHFLFLYDSVHICSGRRGTMLICSTFSTSAHREGQKRCTVRFSKISKQLGRRRQTHRRLD